MHPDTRLIQVGRQSADAADAVNPPLVRASTTLFDTFSAFRASFDEVAFETARYGRMGTSTTFEFQKAMAEISNTESCIATGNGLSAIAAVLGAHATPDASIAIFADVYSPTRVLAETELQPRGCDVRLFATVEELVDMVDASTALVFLEVPGSLTLSMFDVAAACSIAQQAGVPVACDATWGTPLAFDAHGLGVDIAIHAATKYIAGHSDVMLGAITGTFDALASTREWCRHFGTYAAPDSCWLALRGLRTLAVRMERHQSSALTVANWLTQQPQIEAVLFPALPGDPGHELWKAQFSGAPGPFTIELVSCTDAQYAAVIDDLDLFGLGASWGGFESLVFPIIAPYLRPLDQSPNEGRRLRLHIGLEDPQDLIADLARALAHLS